MTLLRDLAKPAVARFAISSRYCRSAPVRRGLRQTILAQLPHFSPSCRRTHSSQAQSTPPDKHAPNTAENASKQSKEKSHDNHQRFTWEDVAIKILEGSATAGASIFLLAVVGYSYTRYYNRMVLGNIELAFETGEPVLELAASGTYDPDEGAKYDRWIPRNEQERIDRIVTGLDKGRYHLIMGEKGTGKGSMLIDAMSKIDAEGVVMMEAHADPEIFRIRLGRCLNFQFHEDNIGALFSIRGPRDAAAILDIERAFNKLEQVALTRRAKIGRPLVLIINSAHLISDDDKGKNLIELIQQRAEQWAAANIAVVVISTDKYWVYERLKQYSTRMEVTYIADLSKDHAIQALRNYRWKYWRERTPNAVLEEVYDRIGGRLTFLNRVAKTTDMIQMCALIEEAEKIWLLNECGILGSEMDDDVMDQQKYAVCIWVSTIL
jgi:hypothetical protein